MPTKDNVNLTRTHAHTQHLALYTFGLYKSNKVIQLSGVTEYLLFLWPANSIWHIF